jgi:hypothetical protein
MMLDPSVDLKGSLSQDVLSFTAIVLIPSWLCRQFRYRLIPFSIELCFSKLKSG